MATNKPIGDNHRIGAVKKRTQLMGSKNHNWTKRDKESGKFIDQKKGGEKFKGVRREKLH